MIPTHLVEQPFVAIDQVGRVRLGRARRTKLKRDITSAAERLALQSRLGIDCREAPDIASFIG